MPVYEYTCEHCKNRFEVLIRGGSATVGCPQCQGAEVRRVMSTFASPSSASEPVPSFCPPQGCGSCCGDPGLCGMN